MAARRYEISLRVLKCWVFYLSYKHQWKTKPFHFNSFFSWCERRDLWSHSNGDILTCEDNMLFSHVKMSSFRAIAHLVFHRCLYKKMRYYMDRRVTSPTWGLPPPLVARKNADSLNTMILDFLVDFKTGESRVFGRLPFPAHWLNIIFYVALYRTLRTLITNVLENAVKAAGVELVRD